MVATRLPADAEAERGFVREDVRCGRGGVAVHHQAAAEIHREGAGEEGDEPEKACGACSEDL